MRQAGQASRYTAAEIAEIRATYAALLEARARRREVMQRLRLRRDDWWRYGSGEMGKKPRREA